MSSLRFVLITDLLVKRLNFIALFSLAFATPFLLLAYSNLFEQVLPMNDVLLYGYWLQQMQLGEPPFGLAQDFVYPYPALLPMWLAKLIGGPAGILVGWTALVAILNSIAIGFLTSWGSGGRKAMLAGTFWVTFLLLLGPAGIGRIDSIAAAVSVFGLVAFSKGRVALAVSLFTFGAWIKIWPFALALSAFISDTRRRIAAYAITAVVAAALIFAVAAGANASLFSFVMTQGLRGIQVESPIAMIWIWAAKLGAPENAAGIYYDKEIITNQVYGSFVTEISMIMTAVMFFALAITVWLAIRAAKSGAGRNELFALTALTAILDLIVFNKVGSPQFMSWLALPILALIIFGVQRLWIPITGVLLIAVTTNLVYPISYMDLMGLGDFSVTLLTIRNLLLIGLLVYANVRLGSLSKKQTLGIKQ
jgi:hypothetical protein